MYSLQVDNPKSTDGLGDYGIEFCPGLAPTDKVGPPPDGFQGWTTLQGFRRSFPESKGGL